ncbi:hypothetical protein J6590_075161, partial [Homalodisca vitripennis]
MAEGSEGWNFHNDRGRPRRRESHYSTLYSCRNCVTSSSTWGGWPPTQHILNALNDRINTDRSVREPLISVTDDPSAPVENGTGLLEGVVKISDRINTDRSVREPLISVTDDPSAPVENGTGLLEGVVKISDRTNSDRNVREPLISLTDDPSAPVESGTGLLEGLVK